jgi:hypothetical protein
MTEPLAGYSLGTEMKNGLTASWVDTVYEELDEIIKQGTKM